MEAPMLDRVFAAIQPRFAQVRAAPLTVMTTAALLGGALAVPSLAEAAAPECAPRTQILKQLASKYSEAPVAIGLSSSGALIEVLTSDTGQTWTILLSRPDGVSCLVAAGQDWQALNPAAVRGTGV
jgi:hypothetical protein